ncbi:MAG: 8-amino-7-oxononanoate synthase [Acholeplasmataceae bacterium]|nr:8-amino-7-oxononanoate synthase [Acholeplasmataceae bacterium]
MEEELKAELDLIEKRGLTRKIKNLRFLDPVRAVAEDGKEYVVFSSNNYLGLTHAPEVIEAAKEANNYGTGSGGARLTTGGHFEAGILEKKLADFKHTEKALIFNTGYMTNLGVLYGLVKHKDVVFSDELNHASIIDGAKISKATVKVYKHADVADLERLLKEDATEGNRFIITDGVFSMDGDIAPLPDLVKLAEKYEATLIVDDAHAVGVIGDDGSGTSAHFGLQGKVDLQVGTMSKALAAEGGYVAGKKIFIDYLINKSRPFIFSTALAPAPAAAAAAALDLLIKNKEIYLQRLWSNTVRMRQLLENACIPLVEGETPIIPIMVGEASLASEIAGALAEKGVLISAIRPPTVAQGQSRLRLTVTAAHTEEQLAHAADLIIKVWQDAKRKRA